MRDGGSRVGVLRKSHEAVKSGGLRGSAVSKALEKCTHAGFVWREKLVLIFCQNGGFLPTHKLPHPSSNPHIMKQHQSAK